MYRLYLVFILSNVLVNNFLVNNVLPSQYNSGNIIIIIIKFFIKSWQTQLVNNQ